MSEYDCPRCGGFRIPGFRHTCPPVWYVILPEIDDEEEIDIYQHPVYATRAEEAAELRVATWMGSDWNYEHGSVTVAIVYDSNGQNPFRFEVEMYMEPTYHARQSRNQEIPPLPQAEQEEELTP